MSKSAAMRRAEGVGFANFGELLERLSTLAEP
jgi:hypothetical protein